MIPPKRFDVFFPLTGGCLEGLDAFWFFFKQHQHIQRIVFANELLIAISVSDVNPALDHNKEKRRSTGYIMVPIPLLATTKRYEGQRVTLW